MPQAKTIRVYAVFDIKPDPDAYEANVEAMEFLDSAIAFDEEAWGRIKSHYVTLEPPGKRKDTIN